jgi:hypothetical protein
MMDGIHLKVHRTAASLKKGRHRRGTSDEPDLVANFTPTPAMALGDR